MTTQTHPAIKSVSWTADDDAPGFNLKLSGSVISDKPTDRADTPVLIPRPLHNIALDIYELWPKVNYAAQPYLDAMVTLNSISDMYGCDTGRSIVAYFLSNATSWRGEDARRIKAELKAMQKATA